MQSFDIPCMDPSKMYLSCPRIHSSLTKSNLLNILDFYKHNYHPHSERMKFITQGETPIITTNDVREIIEVDAQDNELTIAPANLLPIILLTNDVSPQTITKMIVDGKYAIRMYIDIEKDTAKEAGYQKPLFLVNDIYLIHTYLLSPTKMTTTVVKSPSYSYKPAISVT